MDAMSYPRPAVLLVSCIGDTGGPKCRRISELLHVTGLKLLTRSLRTGRIARDTISMEVLTMTIMFITAHITAVGGSLTNNIVTFGDSYSDNGQGFAEYAVSSYEPML